MHRYKIVLADIVNGIIAKCGNGQRRTVSKVFGLTQCMYSSEVTTKDFEILWPV